MTYPGTVPLVLDPRPPSTPPALAVSDAGHATGADGRARIQSKLQATHATVTTADTVVRNALAAITALTVLSLCDYKQGRLQPQALTFHGRAADTAVAVPRNAACMKAVGGGGGSLGAMAALTGAARRKGDKVGGGWRDENPSCLAPRYLEPCPMPGRWR